MTEQKAPLKYVNGTYTGKEFKKKFSNDDGSVTKSFKMKFQIEGKDWTFWSYDTTKGYDNLEEGEDYSIGYIEKENPQGEMPIKVARFFGEPRPEQQQQKQSTTSAQPMPQQSSKDKYGLDREDSIESGQAINMTNAQVTSHPEFQGKIDEETFVETYFKNLALIARCKTETKNRKDKLEQAYEQLDEEMAKEEQVQ